MQDKPQSGQLAETEEQSEEATDRLIEVYDYSLYGLRVDEDGFLIGADLPSTTDYHQSESMFAPPSYLEDEDSPANLLSQEDLENLLGIEREVPDRHDADVHVFFSMQAGDLERPIDLPQNEQAESHDISVDIPEDDQVEDQNISMDDLPAASEDRKTFTVDISKATGDNGVQVQYSTGVVEPEVDNGNGSPLALQGTSPTPQKPSWIYTSETASASKAYF